MTEYTPSIADLGVNPEVESRLLPFLDSFVKWELLRFFQDNPSITARVEDLARYIGRDETEVKPAVRALVNAGFAKSIENEDGQVYGQTGDESVRLLVGGLVESFVEDRLVRLIISSHILKAQRESGRLQQLVH